MAIILKGKNVSDYLTQKVSSEVKELKVKNIFPTLAIIRVGEREDDISYENSAVKRCEASKVDVKKFVLPEDISQTDLIEIIKEINQDPKLHGVLLFRPLPAHIDDETVRNALSPEKDIDGITDISMAGVYSGSKIGFPPCTPRACMEILDFYKIDITGKNIVIIGRSLVVGKPAAMMAIKRDATVTVCHTKTQDMKSIASKADILIVAAGRKNSIGLEYVNNKQIVIDVGINFTQEGKMCGDVDFDKVEPIVEAITPVPGGVGTVTTGILVLQLVEAAKKQNTPFQI